jgi:hypothetical protein
LLQNGLEFWRIYLLCHKYTRPLHKPSISLRYNWPKLMIVLLFAWGMLARAGKAPGRKSTAMLVAIILCLGGRFATFPLPDDRTYLVFVVAFAMILLEAWKPWLDLSME